LPKVTKSVSVRVPKAAELVANVVRRQIVTKELAAGETLSSEAELLERFNISRPTLREAIRILESESLISVRRGVRGGATVQVPDTGTAAAYTALLLRMSGTPMGDVYDARLMIEPALARRLARVANERVIASLQSIVDQERAAVAAGDLVERGHAAIRFHTEVVQQAGNKTRAVLLSTIDGIVSRYASEAALAVMERESMVSLEEHEEFIDHLRERRADEAEVCWRRHMENSATAFARTGAADVLVRLLE
jgi:DNA-binding FadR family transcriptional regulator